MTIPAPRQVPPHLRPNGQYHPSQPPPNGRLPLGAPRPPPVPPNYTRPGWQPPILMPGRRQTPPDSRQNSPRPNQRNGQRLQQMRNGGGQASSALPARPPGAGGGAGAGVGAGRAARAPRARPDAFAVPLPGWVVTKVGLGRICEDDAYSLEWGKVVGRGGRIEIDSENRRVAIILDKAREVQLHLQLYSIKQVFAVDAAKTQNAIDLVFVLSHAPHIFNCKQRQQWIDHEHHQLGQVVNNHILVSFKDANERMDFLDEPCTGLPLHSRRKLRVVDRYLYAPDKVAPVYNLMRELSSPVAFQIDAILCSGTITPQQLIKMEEQIRRIDRTRGPKKAELVLNKFFDSLRRHKWFRSKPLTKGKGLASALEELLDKANDHIHDTLDGQLVDDMTLSRFVVITPTARHLEGPFAERSNSLLRRYGSASDHFIRVSWREEDHSNYFVGEDWDVAAFLHRQFKPLFMRGVHVGARTYQFLGWSSAGLREQTALFVCPFQVGGQTFDAERIRRNMGDFSGCENIPSKFYARISQNFSTSKLGARLYPNEIETMPDIAPVVPGGGEPAFLFTDGCGTISALLAQEVEERMVAQLSQYDRRRQVRSTCYQIRLGGVKGMVSIDPFLPGRMIRIRPSMTKFQSTANTLDIANTFGRPSPAFTNRPLIQILEGLGVRPEAFLKVARAAIEQNHKARASTAGMINLLETVDLGNAAHLAPTLSWLAPLLPPDQADLINDSFIDHAIRLAVAHSLREIKFRSRVPLPGCWTLVGVADEEPGGFLKPNEIYACVQEPGKEPVYLSGLVAISRSPCVHPGDVQMVRAVGRLPEGRAPRIAMQQNCVVFSTQGVRPLPSCLGGGDLDGDMFQLITLPDLLPKRVHKPGDYVAAKPRPLERRSTVEDAATFFIEHTLMSCVGQISVNHMHFADWKHDGIFSAECLELARNHSLALDYTKSGVVVDFREMPKPPVRKPDFMVTERAFDQHRPVGTHIYESQKALGLLYREVAPDDVRPPSTEEDGFFNHADARNHLDQHRIITRALKDAFDLGRPPPALVDEMTRKVQPFCDELHRIARVCALTHDVPISEHECLLGTIVSAAKNNKQKKDSIERLAEFSGSAFAGLRREVGGGRTGDARVERCWAAWNAAVVDSQDGWGVATFGWVVLGELREALEDKADDW